MEAEKIDMNEWIMKRNSNEILQVENLNRVVTMHPIHSNLDFVWGLQKSKDILFPKI